MVTFADGVGDGDGDGVGDGVGVDPPFPPFPPEPPDDLTVNEPLITSADTVAPALFFKVSISKFNAELPTPIASIVTSAIFIVPCRPLSTVW